MVLRKIGKPMDDCQGSKTVFINLTALLKFVNKSREVSTSTLDTLRLNFQSYITPQQTPQFTINFSSTFLLFSSSSLSEEKIDCETFRWILFLHQNFLSFFRKQIIWKIYWIDSFSVERRQANESGEGKAKSQTNISIFCRWKNSRQHRELLCIKCVNYGFGIFFHPFFISSGISGNKTSSQESLVDLLKRLSIVHRHSISTLLPSAFHSLLFLIYFESIGAWSANWRLDPDATVVAIVLTWRH